MISLADTNQKGFGFSNLTNFLVYALTFWYGSKLITDEGLSVVDMSQALFGVFTAALGMGQVAAMAPDLGKGQGLSIIHTH